MIMTMMLMLMMMMMMMMMVVDDVDSCPVRYVCSQEQRELKVSLDNLTEVRVLHEQEQRK